MPRKKSKRARGVTIDRRQPNRPSAPKSVKPFPDRSAFRRSMPLLDPPLSVTLLEDRNDRFGTSAIPAPPRSH
jgi:hypothetical protein